MRKRAMSFNAFERKYEPLDPPPGQPSIGTYIWEYDSLNPGFDAHNVWTVTEGDNGRDWYAGPGYHIVNRIGYVVTQKPWTDADDANGLVVKWF